MHEDLCDTCGKIFVDCKCPCECNACLECRIKMYGQRGVVVLSPGSDVVEDIICEDKDT
jgi:hypothetical protein